MTPPPARKPRAPRKQWTAADMAKDRRECAEHALAWLSEFLWKQIKHPPASAGGRPSH